MGSKAMPVCGVTRGMNLSILRILWLVAQQIIKVEMASLSPLIISAAVIYLLSTFHWALKPSGGFHQLQLQCLRTLEMLEKP